MKHALRQGSASRRADKATDGRLHESSGPKAFLDQVITKVNPAIVKKLLAKQQEADAASAFTQVQRAGLKESTASFRSHSFREAQAADAGKSGKTKYRVILLEEGLGNFGACCYYSRPALESAIQIFDGKKIYADHPSEGEFESRPERSVRDILGHFEDLKLEETKAGRAQLTGDVVVMGGESYRWARELMEHAVEYAKKFPDKEFVGLSINAKGESDDMPIQAAIKRGVPDEAMPKLQEAINQGIDSVVYVHSFTSAISCDLVTEAGAGGKILSLIEGAKKMEKENDSQEGGPGSGRKPGGGSGGGVSDPKHASGRFRRDIGLSGQKLPSARTPEGRALRRAAAQARANTSAVKRSNHSDAIKAGQARRNAQDTWSNHIKSLQQAKKNARKGLESNQSEEEMKKQESANEGIDQSGHDDAAQDMELFRQMLAKHKADGDEDFTDEECAIAKEAYEAHKEMGLEAEAAESEAVKYLKATKHMASKRDAQEAAAEDTSAGSEDGADDKEDDKEKPAQEAMTESATGKKKSTASEETELEKIRAENIRLTGELAAFKESDKKKSVSSHIEKLCKESKMTQTVTASFKKLVEKSKSVEEVDKAWGIFQEGFRAKKSSSAEGELDFGQMLIESEKSDYSTGKKDAIDFGSCKLD